MKKIRLMIALLGISSCAMAQFWPLNSLDIDPSHNAILGSSNKRSLYLVTGDSSRVIVDSLGNVLVPKLAAPADKFYPVFIDGNGRFVNPSNISAPITNTSCDNNYNSWYVGGNTISGGTIAVGTCNDKNFELMAGSDIAVTLKSVNATNSLTPMVGIGKNLTPAQLLDVSDHRTNLNSTSNREHTYIHGDAIGGIETTYDMNLYFGHAFHINYGSYSSASNNLLNLDASGNFSLSSVNVTTNGTTSIGTGINSGNHAMLSVAQANKSNPALILTDNTSSGSGNKDFFKVLGSGYTEINLLSMANDRVLAVRNATNSAAIVDLFVVKNNGKVYAREVEVRASSPFPDYVFSKDYQLRSIRELDSYIQHNAHLPGFETAAYYEQNGMNVNNLLVKQQEKIEELTLYIIELEKRLSKVEAGKK